MRTLYECFCKVGTHNIKCCYLFDRPAVGVRTYAIIWQDDTPLYNIEPIDVSIWDVNEEYVYFNIGVF